MSIDSRRNVALASVAAIVIVVAASVYLGRDRGAEEMAGNGYIPLLVSPAADTADASMLPQTEIVDQPVAEASTVEAVLETQQNVAIVVASAETTPVAYMPTPTEATFDIVRVEPSGDAVIAGQATPGAAVEILRNGQVHAVEIADASGAFVFIASPLPSGSHGIGLQVRGEGGETRLSRQSVTVVIAPARDKAPMVALTEPDRPTVVLSQPDPAADVNFDRAPQRISEVLDEPAPVDVSVARASIRIVSVEAETQGGLFVSGVAAPGASVRLYLNETLVGIARTEDTGSVSFAIRRGLRPGKYRVRLDDVDVRDGRVLGRVEVVFAMPQIVADEPSQPPIHDATAAKFVSQISPRTPVAQKPALVDTVEIPMEEQVERAVTLTIPEISTAIVTRGDSLWRISRRVYGRGVRYTVIYEANVEQIRNPNLIFPGQVFVLPAAEDAGESSAPTSPSN